MRFERFYRELPGADRSYFMFFSSGLLHWAASALRLLPLSVPLVLLGTALEAEERSWAEKRSGRPFHHFDLRIDDASALDLLSDTAETGFGWIHIDSFVLHPPLLEELRTPGPEAVRTVWTTTQLGPVPVAHSALAFFETEPVRRLRETGLRASFKPHSYSISGRDRHAGERQVFDRVPTRDEIEVTRDVLPWTGEGLPAYPSGYDYFPLLSWYQAVAHAQGHPSRAIRDYARSDGAVNGQFTREVIHVNGVATYRDVYREVTRDHPEDSKLRSLPLVRFYPQLLQLESVVLASSAQTLPESYRDLERELAGDVRALGLDPAGTPDRLVGYLGSLGVPPQVLGSLLG